MRVVSPGDGPFSGPAYLTTLLACSRKVISWAEHYRTLVVKRHGGNINVISPKIGLHPLVRAYTDILAMTGPMENVPIERQFLLWAEGELVKLYPMNTRV
jgi:hypothetical protein